MQKFIKNISLLLFIILNVTRSYCQENQQLGRNPEDTFTYKKLAATKSVSKTLELKGSKKLSPDSKKLPITSNDYDIIGTIGSLSVSSTGGADYQIPIEVPPGIKGVQPDISLNYNSQSGNGIAGYGWNINGISTITRLPSTDYHDGIRDGVDLDNLDRFALDGQRLILKSGVYGASGAIYQTENYSNIKIESRGTSTYGPAYFIVNYPDGSKAYYGLNSSSRSLTNYAITFWEDHRQGLRISYEYANVNNSQSIKKIRYGSKYLDTPINEIRFSYNHESNRYDQSYINNTTVVRRHLLNKIEVFGNNVKFRTYDFEFSKSRLNYDRLDKVTETSGNDLKVKAPIDFTYSNTNSDVVYEEVTALGLLEIEKRNAEVVTLDLTGNSETDFLVYPKEDKDKFWLFKNTQASSTNTPWEINTGEFETIFPVSLINNQNQKIPGQGLTIVQNRSSNLVDLKTYANGVSSAIFLQNINTWSAPTYTTYTTPTTSTSKRIEQKYISGDFDGDGLTEGLSIGKPYTQTLCFNTGGGPICNTNIINYRGAYLHDLGASGSNISLGVIDEVISEDDRLLTGDFNGDGKTDILHIKEEDLYVYTINSNNDIELLWHTNDTGINYNTTFLLGDYNGDGKTDILNPTGNNSYVFRVFMSTGTQFSKENRSQPFQYKNTNFNGNNGVLSGFDLVPLDINGDGKTDIIDYRTVTTNGNSNGTQTVRIYNNLGLSGVTTATRIQFEDGGSATKTGNLKHFPIPVFLTSSSPNKNLEFASISDRWVTNFHFTQDHRTDVLLKSVNSNGVKHSIFYSDLDPLKNHFGYDKPIYQTAGVLETFPNINIFNAPGVRVVSRLERTTYNISPSTPISLVKRYYSYFDATHNLNGRGFLGFRGVAQSNWHSEHAERKFNTVIYDPNLRGAKVAQYYQNFDFSFTIPTSNYINKTTFDYSSTLSSAKVFTLNLNSSLKQNSLTGAFNSMSYTYDSYNNPERIGLQYNGGSKTQWIEYINNTSSINYYVGRTKSIRDRSDIGSESFETEKKFLYSDFFLEKIVVYPEGTSYTTEDFERDQYGNIVTRTFTPSGENSRSASFVYDNSGRFLIESTDVENLTTAYSYNIYNGNLEEITNPYGQKTTFLNDSWNRVYREIDYLGNEVETIYREDYDHQKELVIVNRGDDGSSSITYYDVLMRIRRISEKNLLGNWIMTDYLYDNLGRLEKVSEPYPSGESPTQWTDTEYDFYERPYRQTLHTGREINISYDGLSTTVDDGIKTVTRTLDGAGNTLSITDPGGTINYDYYGNGNLKSSNNGGVIVNIEQDSWGRKTKLVDPSAGTFEYEYNGYGQITKEISPKGETQYIYSQEGKLIEKGIVGDYTDLRLNYSYNANHKFLESLQVISTDGNNSSYTYDYDDDLRLDKVIEQNPYAIFTKEYSYDSFGRLETEELAAQLLQNNRTSSKKFSYTYEYGQLKSITDFNTNSNIWQINDVNARGQLVSTLSGSDVTTEGNFTPNGYLERKKVQTTDNLLMDLETSFNEERGTLTSRSNSMFSWSETFEYDNLDRLIEFNDNDGNNRLSYDSAGRITSNSSIGDYEYSGNSYRVSTIDLNDEGDLYYQQHASQRVKYNAANRPFEINEQGQERIGFQYNAFMGRSHMFYGDTEEELEDRNNRKHYSFNGSMEISHDALSGTTTFVTYIGGDGYTAPAIWKSEQSLLNSTNDYYYLHRDYLGSIMLITDGVGEPQEKRHFDAWGNIVKVTDGNGGVLDKLTFLDRGYTGHEHLQGVGLIHMNARLYDPKTKRFLSPDNYIQDSSDTQNFNRYSYVLNNPLKYADYTGNFVEPVSASVFIGAAIVGSIIANTDWKPVGDWIGKNYNSALNDIGNFTKAFGQSIKVLGKALGGLFGGGSKRAAPIEYTSPNNSNSDPLASSSASTGLNFFGVTGSSGGLGILGKFAMFELGAQAGFVAGAQSSWNFAKSLTTAQGWRDLGQGLINVAEIASQHSGRGMILRAQIAQSASNYVTNIPNMSAYEMGYDVGYGTEKVIEGALLSRGAGAVANGLKAARAGTSLGAGRIGVKNWLQSVGNLDSNTLIQNIESVGFKRMSPKTSPVSVFERGGMRIRLDPPQSGTPFNHMHLEYGGNSYDIFLNQVHYRSPAAHIPIK